MRKYTSKANPTTALDDSDARALSQLARILRFLKDRESAVVAVNGFLGAGLRLGIDRRIVGWDAFDADRVIVWPARKRVG